MKDKEISILETEECTRAHVDYETERVQSMQEHAGNVAFFSSNVCELPELKNLVELAGILHDAGKITAEIAKAKAETEFEKYRVVQDRLFMSDFDKYMLELEESTKK